MSIAEYATLSIGVWLWSRAGGEDTIGEEAKPCRDRIGREGCTKKWIVTMVVRDWTVAWATM
jgi:hypothetical protein